MEVRTGSSMHPISADFMWLLWYFKDDQNAETGEERQSSGAFFRISPYDSTDILNARFLPEMKHAVFHV